MKILNKKKKVIEKWSERDKKLTAEKN